MKNFLFAFVAVAAICSFGCDHKPASPPAQKIQVDAPGVKVDVEPGKGVQIQAPGVEVDTKK